MPTKHNQLNSGFNISAIKTYGMYKIAREVISEYYYKHLRTELKAALDAWKKNDPDYHEPIDWTRIDNDSNGNPRYVCHSLVIHECYVTAVKLANKIGGRKYHNKQYGGGIVFQSYNINETEKAIHNIKQEEN